LHTALLAGAARVPRYAAPNRAGLMRSFDVALVSILLGVPAFGAPASALPHPAHVVVIVEENRSYRQIVGSSRAPYLNALARRGALFRRSYAVTHPSLPNYLALLRASPTITPTAARQPASPTPGRTWQPSSPKRA
jgi:hypothetical protein